MNSLLLLLLLGIDCATHRFSSSIDALYFEVLVQDYDRHSQMLEDDGRVHGRHADVTTARSWT